MTYFKTYQQLHKHMVRFHNELRHDDRGIKNGGLKDSEEYFRKRNEVMNNEVEMCGDGFKNQDTESDNESNSYSEEDNSEKSEQSGGEESDLELSEQTDSEENDSES